MSRSSVRGSPIRGAIDTAQEVSYVTLASISGFLLTCILITAGFWVAGIVTAGQKTAYNDVYRITDSWLSNAGSADLFLQTMFQAIVVACLLILVAIAVKHHKVFQ